MPREPLVQPRAGPDGCTLLCKRLADICVSCVGLLLLGPFILLCICAATLDTRRVGLFVQKRIGRRGEPFRLLKVRTMRDSQGCTTSITTALDLRVTRLGRLLRKWKIDELPQLWNVLVGDMSLVGPRPDVPGYMDKLEGEERLILELRPGITGPASLRYANEETLLAAQHDPEQYNDAVIFPDKVRINLEYYYRCSPWLDLRIVLITLGLLAPRPDDFWIQR